MPSVQEVHEFIPDPKAPSYYVFIWGVPHRLVNEQRKPQQIFRADRWPEAQSFAKVFAGLTNQQYATAIALAPRVPDEMGGHGEELARENYWRTDKHVTFDRYTMPAGRVKQLQQEFSGSVAMEVDPEERQRKIKELMAQAKPGETLVDVLVRNWERERLEKSQKEWHDLWHGKPPPLKQGKLSPVKKPKRELKTAYEFQGLKRRPEYEIDWKDYWMLRQLKKDGPLMKSYLQIWSMAPEERFAKLVELGLIRTEKVKGEPGYAITQGGEKVLSGGRAYEKEAGPPCTHCGRPTRGVCSVCHKPVCRSCWHISRDYHLARGENPVFYEDPQAAFEKEAGSGWDLKLSNPRGFFTLTGWALRNKRSDVGTQELKNALDEAKTGGADLTANEARGRVESAEEPSDHPWIDIHMLIDFETIEERSRAAQAGQERLEQLKEELDQLVASKVISKEQAKDTLIGIEREKLPSKQKKMLQDTIASLQKKLAAATIPPPKQKYKLGQKVQYLGKPDYEIADADLENRAWVYTVRRIGMPGEFIARESELRPDLAALVEERIPRDAWEGLIKYLNRELDNMRIDDSEVHEFIGQLANWIEEQVKAGRRRLTFGPPPAPYPAEFDLLTGTLRTKESTWEKLQEELAHQKTPITFVQPAPRPAEAPPQVMPQKPRVSIAVPKVVEAARRFSQPEVDFLENAFRTIISSKQRRDPFPAELDQFEKLVATMEQMSPPLKFTQATKRIEDLARAISAKGTPGRIIVKRGQARVNELLEKMLKGPLTEDEKDELEQLQGRSQPEIFESEEVYYEPPKIKIIADDGPHPAMGGRPVEHGKEYPRELGSYWTIEIAELNQANFQRKGFKTRIETD